MRRFLKYMLCMWALMAIGSLSAAAYRVAEIPHVQQQNRLRYVSNPDGILSAEAVARIDAVCDSLRVQRVAEVAVVAVREIASEDVFSFAIELFSTWGVGQADGDNGLGILLVESAREIRFVTGDGLEGILSDALCKRIQMQVMLPAFREGDYSAGMVAGVEAVASILQGGEPLPEESDVVDVWLLLLFVVVLPLGCLVLVWYVASRCPHCGRPKLKFVEQRFVKDTLLYSLYEQTFRCGHCGASVKRAKKVYKQQHGGSNGSAGGPFIGGFGGGRGFGGGGSFGGGFGGGHFGGGGAGSRW